MKEEKGFNISPADEIFARKITSHLNEGLNLSDVAKGRLLFAHEMAMIAKRKSDSERGWEIREIQDKISGWFKRGYVSMSNNLVALALVATAIPVGMNVVSFEGSNGGVASNISAVIDPDSYYIDNIYHTHADSLDESYLQEMGLI